MLFVGDIHGEYELLPVYKDFVQVGDAGIGFVKFPDGTFRYGKFIRGNHDNPELCQTHQGYLGDWAYRDGILFISGAGSVDKDQRIWGVDWWPNEELTYEQMNEILDLDEEKFPVHTVVSHDCPKVCYPVLVSHHIYDTFTTPKFLDQVLTKFNPKIWVHGHHHKSLKYRVRNTNFYSLGIGEQRNVKLPNEEEE